MKHCICALHSHSFCWNILLIIPFYLLFGAFLLVATKYCFPPVFVSCFSWILWACDVFGRKLTLYCILMWTKKLNGKVPRKRFPKDPMPKREMDSIQSHNKENGKTSNFFLMLCDFVCDCVLLILFAPLSSEVGFELKLYYVSAFTSDVLDFMTWSDVRTPIQSNPITKGQTQCLLLI